MSWIIDMVRKGTLIAKAHSIDREIARDRANSEAHWQKTFEKRKAVHIAKQKEKRHETRKKAEKLKPTSALSHSKSLLGRVSNVREFAKKAPASFVGTALKTLRYQKKK